MNEKKELKLEFAPGCFDNFEGTQEELNELIAEIQQMFKSGAIEEHSHQLSDDDFDDLPNEVKEKLLDFFNEEESGKVVGINAKRNLQ
jgi:Mg/Co/Ni transporter MgtE